MERKHKDILITGEIQNIGFTFQVMRAADKFNIYGYAAYINTKTVKIEAEGKENDLAEFVDWCRFGVRKAKISEIVVSPNSFQDYDEFTISGKK